MATRKPKSKAKKTVRMFRTIADVLRHEFIGNHYSDYPAFTEIDEMAKRLYRRGKMKDAMKVLNHTFKAGMGLDDKDLIRTKRELKEHIEEYLS